MLTLLRIISIFRFLEVCFDCIRQCVRELDSYQSPSLIGLIGICKDDQRLCFLIMVFLLGRLGVLVFFEGNVCARVGVGINEHDFTH